MAVAVPYIRSLFIIAFLAYHFSISLRDTPNSTKE